MEYKLRWNNETWKKCCQRTKWMGSSPKNWYNYQFEIRYLRWDWEEICSMVGWCLGQMRNRFSVWCRNWKPQAWKQKRILIMAGWTVGDLRPRILFVSWIPPQHWVFLVANAGQFTDQWWETQTSASCCSSCPGDLSGRAVNGTSRNFTVPLPHTIQGLLLVQSA